MRCRWWAAVLLALAAALAQAGEPPDLDERAAQLTAQLRCPVCENQTLLDSQSELAVQLRGEVRRQLSQGATEAQVRDFMVQRYGDQVLYQPPLKPSTWLLWAGPLLLLLAAAATLAVLWRHRPPLQDDAPAAPPSPTPAARP